MILRPARPGDAADICAISNPIIRDTLVTFTTTERGIESVVRDIKTRAEAFQVAETGGRVVGFATYGPFRSGPGYAFAGEHSIQLAADARGQGTGRTLMHRLQQVAADQGIHVLVAGISGANPAAVAFHSAIGFAQVGRMPQVGFKAGRWLDLILMQRILTPGPDGAPDTGAGAG